MWRLTLVALPVLLSCGDDSKPSEPEQNPLIATWSGYISSNSLEASIAEYRTPHWQRQGVHNPMVSAQADARAATIELVRSFGDKSQIRIEPGGRWTSEDGATGTWSLEGINTLVLNETGGGRLTGVYFLEGDLLILNIRKSGVLGYLQTRSNAVSSTHSQWIRAAIADVADVTSLITFRYTRVTSE